MKSNTDVELTITYIKKTLTEYFIQSLGYKPNFDDPRSFNEKINWLKLYDKNPLLTKCADKFLMRDYIKETIAEEYLIDLLGVWDNPDEIDFDLLPNQFVLKVNWGSGQNIICKDKNKLDIDMSKEKLSEWLRPENNHYFMAYEWCYKDIKPKIICERYMSQNDGGGAASMITSFIASMV